MYDKVNLVQRLFMISNLIKSIFGTRNKRLLKDYLGYVSRINDLESSYQKLKKDQKVEVMHVAVCALLSQWGYYEFTGHDEDGWPHWKETSKIPSLNAKQQDGLIREAIVEYFS